MMLRVVIALIVLCLVAEAVLGANQEKETPPIPAPPGCAIYQNINRSDSVMWVVQCKRPLPDTLKFALPTK